MKFLIIGDLHGNKPKIMKNEFDAIIAPGDFCSDSIRKYMFQAMRENREKGTKKTWIDILGVRKAKKELDKSLNDGRRILEFLDSFGKPVYVVPGNWDFATVSKKIKLYDKNHWNERLLPGLDNVIDCHQTTIDIGDYQIIGHGIISGPEFETDKQELAKMTKKELREEKKYYYERMVPVDFQFKLATKPVIFLSHNVPLNTNLDQIVNPSSPRDGEHFGSLIAREMCERYNPLVCIGGHMHEHFGQCKISRTTVINAGFGSDVNVYMELQGKKIKEIKFLDPKKLYDKKGNLKQ